ncbi:Uncharacterized protein OS=Planctomyces brasiliensis (strain ATCC 49424 / DSM 5305 / JCM 21570 / NBRC 103401 / IFAM 1448) GN=Plabr_2334 PE=4 SV=1: NTP_transf_5 [Gemmataceae bacterium]|nr:Uncharacterized protein OS=Planctomyces brasiliensis (strain ATCC 49424 / DSM 5305 / JCM 21570 / NBRC 103401 / IFAM 1448) GN=Plabr_2334 PE=4 SV=1: NTP_transf_5 [Gemmataceae bacterium]VTT99887.1 Uncharacterized protein OS=Planctomyces brasiliensis (strain ATCC 49424 / DSM 5305 / JCM 21570 / NBRC 103401 / IFAM 1448) GN=Plabr_2334 PE=4 SV=1: NTP_transf_5 [Gemmataceae bacterium]
MVTPSLQAATWERMIRAVEKVRERCDRATKALDAAGLDYAVVGGHAVANWVASVDETLVRNTRDVDILVRRTDLDAVKRAMDAIGYDFAETSNVSLFFERPNGKPSEGIHLLFSGEKVKAADPVPAPDVTESERGAAFRVLSLEALVRMKLVANRDKDRTHIRDLIGVGLIDASWPEKFPDVLGERLRGILANPDG